MYCEKTKSGRKVLQALYSWSELQKDSGLYRVMICKITLGISQLRFTSYHVNVRQFSGLELALISMCTARKQKVEGRSYRLFIVGLSFKRIQVSIE